MVPGNIYGILLDVLVGVVAMDALLQPHVP